MTPAGFVPATPVSKPPQTHALDRAATTAAGNSIPSNTTITNNTNTNIIVIKIKQDLGGNNKNYKNV
jgi:hypothetical protein